MANQPEQLLRQLCLGHHFLLSLLKYFHQTLWLSKKYSLGVLTNVNADVYKFAIGKYFEFSISSLEAKNSKPHRAHFDMAISEMEDVSFNEILHIGDHQINDILFAYNLGIDVLWFNNNNAEWVQDFKKPQEFSSWDLLPKIIENKYER